MMPTGFLEDKQGFRWSLGVGSGGRAMIDLVSQVWKEGEWRHGLVVSEPPAGKAGSGCVLHVTGGPANEPDLLWADALARLSGLSVATLFDIPVQPLWGHVEDDLIAHTFERFLETGDETWPLLMPMVRSTVRAMDALQESGMAGGPFVVTGASKRGWTSWLTGCTGDRRVAGIAPMVFDFLKMPQQLAKQAHDWGALSPMISDYTTRELEESVETENGVRLLGLVDPAEDLERLRVPVLLVLGTNDTYWTIDAQTLYWDDLEVPKSLVMVPNMAHGWGSTEYWTPTLAAFALSVVECGSLPQWSLPEFEAEGRAADVRTFRPGSADVLWAGRSADRNFSQSQWEPVTNGTVEAGDEGWTALFAARPHQIDGIAYWTSTPVRVLARRSVSPA